MRILFLLVWGILFGSAGEDEFSNKCRKERLADIAGKSIWVEEDKVLFFESGFAVDADGSPRAYHPDNIGLDDLQHAGKEWEGIAHDEKGPIVQGPHDPAPGYYVSQTSLEYIDKKYSDPARYINAEVVPYIVLPHSLTRQSKTKLGDIALVWNRENDWFCYAIFADTGPEGKIGEGSIALAEKLGINPNPRIGGTDANIVYVVFPGSGNGGPLPEKEIEERGKKHFEKWGGFDKTRGCLEKY